MRPGLYVDGNFFGLRLAQAKARADLLAKQYGRAVKVVEMPVRPADPLSSSDMRTLYKGEPA